MFWLYLYLGHLIIGYSIIFSHFCYGRHPSVGKRQKIIDGFKNGFLIFIPVVGIVFTVVCIGIFIGNIGICINHKLNRWADNDPNIPKNIIKKEEKIIEKPKEAPIIIEEPISPLDINLD